MGMAASQARFLGLTARKTNTEYEGQQVNQQRTVLANETANYYNQLLGMSVPVPPAVADYTKTVYTFNDGSLANSISSMVAQKDGLYLISYTSTWTNDFSAISAAPVIYTRVDTSTTTTPAYDYYVGSRKLREMETRTDAAINAMTDADCEAFKGDDPYLTLLSNNQLKQLLKEENEYIKKLNDKYGTQAKNADGSLQVDSQGNPVYDSQWMVRYVLNTSTNTWSPYFVNKKILDSDNTIYSENGISQSGIRTYTIGSAKETEEIKGVKARMEQDSTGRIINITLHPGEDDEVTYAVTTNTVTDQAKYDDAMNQYEYDKAEYDQSIQEINAKIEIIQSQDKNLELRLKQLDTEQDAIQTEMDAVQKVIEKNTESTFKTFG